MKNLTILLLIALLVTSCAPQEESPGEDPRIAYTGITESIKPGDNFFMRVNKMWYDTAKIADDQAGVGSYSFLNIPQRKLLENILEGLAGADNSQGSLEQKVGDYYASGMDTDRINDRGYRPIQARLERIDAMTNTKDITKFVADELKNGHTSLITMGVSPDNENSTINMLHFSQSGLGLPDRDYYFKEDDATLGV